MSSGGIRAACVNGVINPQGLYYYLRQGPSSRRPERVALGRLEGDRESRRGGEGASLAAEPTRKWAEPPTQTGAASAAVGGTTDISAALAVEKRAAAEQRRRRASETICAEKKGGEERAPSDR